MDGRKSTTPRRFAFPGKKCECMLKKENYGNEEMAASSAAGSLFRSAAAYFHLRIKTWVGVLKTLISNL
jgi:hypothetical protein